MLRRRTKCARREHIPLLSEVVGVKRYEFFELDIFHTQIIDKIGKDTLMRTSQRIKTMEHQQVGMLTASDSMVFQPPDMLRFE